MLKVFLVSLFFSISLFGFTEERNGVFVLQKDSINNIRYYSNYIYFTKIVDFRIYDIKEYNLRFLKKGIYIFVIDDKTMKYFK